MLEENEPEPEDLSANTSDLVWEGELRSRNFKIWVGQREASNDAAARNWLGKEASCKEWTIVGRSLQIYRPSCNFPLAVVI